MGTSFLITFMFYCKSRAVFSTYWIWPCLRLNCLVVFKRGIFSFLSVFIDWVTTKEPPLACRWPLMFLVSLLWLIEDLRYFLGSACTIGAGASLGLMMDALIFVASGVLPVWDFMFIFIKINYYLLKIKSSEHTSNILEQLATDTLRQMSKPWLATRLNFTPIAN